MKTTLSAAPAIQTRAIAQPRRRAGWPAPDALALSLLAFVLVVVGLITTLAVSGLG